MGSLRSGQPGPEEEYFWILKKYFLMEFNF